jgi:hypothetical protein
MGGAGTNPGPNGSPGPNGNTSTLLGEDGKDGMVNIVLIP